MTDVAKVQQLPTETAESVDVLNSLKGHLSDELFGMLSERVDYGFRKYGSRLKTYNGRDVLLDCLQEALDGIMYGQQAFLQGVDDGRIRDRFISIVRTILEVRGAREKTEPASHGNKETNVANGE